MFESSPFIIAELSGNHDQDFELAKAMIHAAAEAGVDAIKLQTYTADTMTLDVREGEFMVSESDSLWKGNNLYDLYAKASTPWEWHQPLFELAESLGLVAFSSPFDLTAVAFLETLNVPLYKIASFEMTDIPLIEAVAKTGKPIIMSTGMATKEEIDDAVATIRAIGDNPLTLLKCTSTYPAKIADSNLLTMADLAAHTGCPVGLSDHTKGLGVAVAATALGANVIEKHFVLDRQAGGVDAEFSMEPAEMKAMVEACRDAHASLGKVIYGGSDAEQAAKKYRRSIYLTKDLPAGTELTENHLQIIRPAFGLAPKHWPKVLGKTLSVDVKKGQPLAWDLLA
ncbi:pseudaminic acid synthase [Marinomonas posidonica]|uniref:Pseudaminic acid synthase n=1 Tax=Marinomonas posidonica (strain CECT 7376 / NCIMB 14433 / IVIA-Po-181) TaxID=491952 RepID=F6CZK0_MARPP|nr:pseudaminic acid synthase [Marinomonas posidonica]AEF55812.1 pseudaminic acid synthase [Marinomonas posidonica IVIA-Po-181]